MVSIYFPRLFAVHFWTATYRVRDFSCHRPRRPAEHISCTTNFINFRQNEPCVCVIPCYDMKLIDEPHLCAA